LRPVFTFKLRLIGMKVYSLIFLCMVGAIPMLNHAMTPGKAPSKIERSTQDPRLSGQPNRIAAYLISMIKSPLRFLNYLKNTAYRYYQVYRVGSVEDHLKKLKNTNYKGRPLLNWYFTYPGGGYWFLFVDDPNASSEYKLLINAMHEDYLSAEKFLMDHYIPFKTKNPRANHTNIKQQAQEMIKTYKIHLMPKTSNRNEIITELIREIHNDKEFAKAIRGIKIRAIEQYTYPRDDHQEITPIIVIYAHDGKSGAQKILDKVYDLFKGLEGLNQTPSYNKKVTSLIYYAQGNRDDKKEILRNENLKKWINDIYEEDLVHYNPALTEDKPGSYHLVIPK